MKNQLLTDSRILQGLLEVYDLILKGFSLAAACKRVHMEPVRTAQILALLELNHVPYTTDDSTNALYASVEEVYALIQERRPTLAGLAILMGLSIVATERYLKRHNLKLPPPVFYSPTWGLKVHRPPELDGRPAVLRLDLMRSNRVPHFRTCADDSEEYVLLDSLIAATKMERLLEGDEEIAFVDGDNKNCTFSNICVVKKGRGPSKRDILKAKLDAR